MFATLMAQKFNQLLTNKILNTTNCTVTKYVTDNNNVIHFDYKIDDATLTLNYVDPTIYAAHVYLAQSEVAKYTIIGFWISKFIDKTGEFDAKPFVLDDPEVDFLKFIGFTTEELTPYLADC